MLHTKAWDGIKPGTTITADQTITGAWLDLGSVRGSLSIFLRDANGVSTSIDVTYEIGVFPGAESFGVRGYAEKVAKLLKLLPADGGSVGLNLDCNAQSAYNNIVHKTLAVPDAQHVRFLVHNDAVMGDALCDLIVVGQV